MYMDESSFVLLYKSMVRPHVEYANSVWYPYKQGSKNLKKFKKELLTTKLVINLKTRWLYCGMPTIQYWAKNRF